MKVKAEILLQAVPILKNLDMMEMKLSVAHKMKKIIQEAQIAIEDVEARRIKLAETYGTLNEDKSKYEFEEGQHELFADELKKIFDEEIDLDIKPIPVELVDEHINIAPAGVGLVSWAITGLE